MLHAKVLRNIAPFKYRPLLHSVRRVTDADFKAGFRVKQGTLVACAGAWDRKGIVERVHTICKDGEWTAVKCDVVFAGHYFRNPSNRVLQRLRYRYNSDLRRTSTSERSTKSRYRFTGQLYVEATKVSRSVMTFWFDRDGKLRLTTSGWVPVVPVLRGIS